MEKLSQGGKDIISALRTDGTFPIQTAVGSAAAGSCSTGKGGGGDYVSKSGTLTFTSSGPTSQNVNVRICRDSVAESPETFTVTLSNPSNATITRATGTATIQD